MGNNNDKWSALSMKDRAELINIYVKGGMMDLKEIKKHYNSFSPGGPIKTDEYGYPADIEPAVVVTDYPREAEVWKQADASTADIIQRLKEGASRQTIQDWENQDNIATHKMMSADNYVVGNVQNINGQLFDFTDPKHKFENPDRAAIESAIRRGDYVEFETPGDARYFAEHYKKHYNSFDMGGDTSNNDDYIEQYMNWTDLINPVLNLKHLDRKQLKEVAKTTASNTDANNGITYSEVLNNKVDIAGRKGQVNRFKRLTKKYHNELENDKKVEEQTEFAKKIRNNKHALVGNIGGPNIGGEQGDTSVQDIAYKSIMTPLLLTNPVGAAFLEGVGEIYNTPGIKQATDAYLTYKGLENLASENGIRKTINLFKQGKYPWAVKSAAGDVMDAVGPFLLIDDIYKFGKEGIKFSNWLTRNSNRFKKFANPKVTTPPEFSVTNTGYINSIDDVTLDPYAKTEIPEEAFISKLNPVDEVKQKVALIESQLQDELKSVYSNQKVQAILNRQDLFDFNLNTNIASNTELKLDLNKLRDLLIKEGVNPDLLTDNNLKKLISARYIDYTSNITDNIALRNNILLDNPTQPHIYQYTQFRPEGNVGYAYIYDNTNLGNKVGMVENTTSGANKIKGVSEQAYNSVIGDLGNMTSGELLLDADATMHVLSKYPNKTVISSGTGHHWYETGHKYGDIFMLDTPTYEVPVKYLDEFGLEGVSPEGNFIIDFAKGPRYSLGGKMNRFDMGGDTNTPSKTKEQIATELQSKDKNELLSLQQTLADAGYYDQTLQLGKNDSALGLQDFLIKKGLLTVDDRDGNVGENTLKALQTFLVNEKYLPRYTETGYDNIDGKLGNTTQNAYNAYLRKSNVDGWYGDKTLNAYYNYLNQNDNAVYPTNISNLTEEEFFKYINTPIRQKTWQSNNFKGWSDEDLRYLYSKLATTGWDPKALMYAIDRETNFMPYAKNSITSAIGLAQLTKAQLKQLYKDSYKDLTEKELTDKVNNVYNSYRNKTRSIRDIIDDTILQYSWMRNRIKTEPHNMGYGRIKVNLLAPNASLDSKVPKYVYEGSLTKAQQAKIKLGEATYRDLMKMYDEEFKNKFNLQ